MRRILLSSVVLLAALLGCEGSVLEGDPLDEPEMPWCWLPELPGLCELSYDDPRALRQKILDTECPFDSEEIVVESPPLVQKLCRHPGWIIEVAGYYSGLGYAYLLPDLSLIQCDTHDNIVRINPLVIDEFGGYRHLLNDIQLPCIEDGSCELISQYRGIEPCL